MSNAQWAVLAAAAAVLALWMVGAYNRLVDLRNRIGAAFGEIDSARRTRAEAATALLALLREPLEAERGALDGFASAHQQADVAAAALSAAPVSAAAAAAWVRAEAALAAAAARLMALAEQWVGKADSSGGDAAAGAAALLQWRAEQSRIAFARRAYDQTAAAYNAAARQRPTRWLLPLFGFDTAGLLG